MNVRLRDPRQALVGLIFLAVGLLLISQLGKYRLGSATHMGPGYFPLILAIALFGLGTASLVQSLAGIDQPNIARISLKPLVFLTAGVVTFGLLIERAGLIPSTLALILLISFDRIKQHPGEVGLVFLGVAVLTNVLFVLLLGLPIAAF